MAMDGATLADDENMKKILQGVGDGEGDFSSNAFEALERDFQDVLSELVGDKSLERFRLEYEKLHRALKKSHEQEKRLIKKCRELNGEIVNNAAKVQTALKLSQEDQATITTLRKDIEKAWAMVDVAHEKEVRAKETISQLKDEISNLSQLVEKGAGLSIGQDTMVKELIRVRDELAHRVDEQTQTLRMFETQLTELNTQHEILKTDKATADQTVADLRDTVTSKDNEISRELRRRERIDKELHSVRGRLDGKSAQNEELTLEIAHAQQATAAAKKQLSEARATMQKYLHDYDALFGRTQTLTKDLEEQMLRNAQLAAEQTKQEKATKLITDEAAQLQATIQQWEHRLERERQQAERYKVLYNSSKTPLGLAQAEIQSLQREIDNFRRLEEQHRKQIDVAERDISKQKAATKQAEDRTHVQEDSVKEHQRIVSSLEAELTSYKSEVNRVQKETFRLEKEREKFGTELSEARAMYMQALEDVKLRDMDINELTKKVSEWEAKLKQQQQLYEGVRSDRNLYSKNLIEAEDEIAEMKRKFKIMNHQIEQLKEEITAKDYALVVEHGDHQKVEKQREQMRNEMDRLKRLLESNDDIIHKQDAEIRRLAGMIRKMDEEALRQRKEYDQVINERDILGTQLIRRNDELALLYEKLKIQQSTLRKGEASYAQRMIDIRALKLKAQDLMRDLAVSKNNSNQLTELRREALQTQRELLQERTKVKALSEELENPMNVHRWRKLEGSDPASYEMIQKIQTLQRRLITKTEEVVEKDLLLQEKQRLYKEIKAILARQPGPEVAEQLSVYQTSLKEKTRQMKAMAAELNMCQAQVNEYRYEMERLGRETQDIKRKYYEQKRKDQVMRDLQMDEEPSARNNAVLQAQAHAASVKRFTGGGFAINP